MARKALKDTAKLLGGLGTAYVLSEALGPRVRPEDVNQADALADPTTVKMMQDAERKRKEDAALARLQTEPTTSLRKAGGVVSASKRADGCAQRGKTRGKMV